MSRKDKKKKQQVATIADQYDESSRVLTDEEAHRDVKYELPSFFTQMIQCFIVQMKRYARQKMIWICLICLLLIPVGYFAISSIVPPGEMLPDTDVANIYMAGLLSVGPMLIPLLASVSCGSMLSQEFNERTVFLSLPLPMSRSAFYVGKFLAGLALIEGTVAAAYGISALIAMKETQSMYTSMMFSSFLLALFYTFFCCALSYALSTKMKRGSSMVPFVLLFLVLPLIAVILMIYGGSDFLSTILSYTPCLAIDMAENMLGNVMVLSGPGVYKMMFSSHAMYVLSTNNLLMNAISFIISVILLALGYKAIKGRDM